MLVTTGFVGSLKCTVLYVYNHADFSLFSQVSDFECRDFSVAPLDMKWLVSLSWQLHLTTYLALRRTRASSQNVGKISCQVQLSKKRNSSFQMSDFVTVSKSQPSLSLAWHFGKAWLSPSSYKIHFVCGRGRDSSLVLGHWWCFMDMVFDSPQTMYTSITILLIMSMNMHGAIPTTNSKWMVINIQHNIKRLRFSPIIYLSFIKLISYKEGESPGRGYMAQILSLWCAHCQVTIMNL